MSTKKTKGQFYTVSANYILEGFAGPSTDARCVIEPFAGQGDLLIWLTSKGYTGLVEAYDIDPKKEDIQLRDTLLNPPDYRDAWILTNPPFLARNKSASKAIFDHYGTNDLYKCFLTSLTNQEKSARGGILILPAGFFMSPRDLDVRCRAAFLSRYKITAVRYFEETVFPDTTTTVVAIAFEAATSSLTSQTIPWTILPAGTTRNFLLNAADDWIVGGDIYRLNGSVRVRRHVEGQPLKNGEQRTELTLSALDSGKADGRICLEYRAGYCYPAKDTSRTYATLCIQGRTLSVDEQKMVATRFNEFLEAKRTETCSLFLPQYRESKEYARKRIPFELAYSLVSWIISQLGPQSTESSP
jgi:hypothetical protein